MFSLEQWTSNDISQRRISHDCSLDPRRARARHAIGLKAGDSALSVVVPCGPILRPERTWGSKLEVGNLAHIDAGSCYPLRAKGSTDTNVRSLERSTTGRG